MNIEQWERDLRLARWTEVRRNVWRRPEDGALFRGPYGAWCALQAEHITETGKMAQIQGGLPAPRKE